MPLSVIYSHADKPLIRALEINPDVWPLVKTLLLKALAKKGKVSVRPFYPFYAERDLLRYLNIRI
jgi:hypothetical protein